MRFFVQQDAMQPMLRGYGVWRRVPNIHAYSTCPVPFNVVMRCLYIAWEWMRSPFPYYETTRAHWERRALIAEARIEMSEKAQEKLWARIREMRRAQIVARLEREGTKTA